MMLVPEKHAFVKIAKGRTLIKGTISNQNKSLLKSSQFKARHRTGPAPVQALFGWFRRKKKYMSSHLFIFNLYLINYFLE